MKKYLLLIAFFIFNTTIAQSVNDYKYVVVPSKFDFLKEPNKYNMNSLTKMLFQKYGFEVFMMDEALPTEIANNRCKALFADVVEDN